MSLYETPAKDHGTQPRAFRTRAALLLTALTVAAIALALVPAVMAGQLSLAALSAPFGLALLIGWAARRPSMAGPRPGMLRAAAPALALIAVVALLAGGPGRAPRASAAPSAPPIQLSSSAAAPAGQATHPQPAKSDAGGWHLPFLAPLAAKLAAAAPDSTNKLLAGPLNGSFETGSLANWAVGGSAGNAEALLAANVNPPATPPAGSYMALLCNGPGPVGAPNATSIDGDGLNTDDNDRTTLTQSFTLLPSEVPATLSFKWSWLTAENPAINDEFDDFFRVQLNGTNLLVGSANGKTLSPFANIPTSGANTTITSAGPTNGCGFDYGRSAFTTYRQLITTPGLYTLEFLVSDQGSADRDIDSGLLIDDVRVEPEVDMEITKVARPDPAVAGSELIYDVTVTNRGSGRATGVIVTDTLPAEVVYASDTQGCNTGALPDLYCALGDMLGGTTKTFSIKVLVNANALSNGPAFTLTNRAEVDAVNEDPNPDNDVFFLNTLINERADLSVIKLSKPDDTVRAGDTFTYTILVENLGPSDARGVFISDTILSSGLFNVTSVTNDPLRNDTCSPATVGGGPSAPTVLMCRLDEPLEPVGPLSGGTGRWVIQVAAVALDAGDIDNIVRVSTGPVVGAVVAQPPGGTPDPNQANNMAVDAISVFSTADIGITKLGFDPADLDSTMFAGQEVDYTIVVANNGPSTAENVTIYDNLPPGLLKNSILANFTTSAGGGGICTVGTPGNPLDPMICQVGNLANGAFVTIIVQADVDPNFVVNTPNTTFSDFLSNDAWTKSDVLDPDTSNNRVADALVEVLSQANVQVFKTVRPVGNVLAGQNLTYEIIVNNVGPSTAEDVLVNDMLPPGLIFLDAVVINGIGGEKCTYVDGANQVVCNLGDIQPGKPPLGQRYIYVTLQVPAAMPGGTITNTVTGFSFQSADPLPVDNTDITRTIVVNSSALMTITKVASDPSPVAGQDFYYTIRIRNGGPSTAHNVFVTDVLPANVTYLYDTANCGQGALIAGCSFGALQPAIGRDDGVIEFRIYVRLNANANCDGVVTNSATVGWQDYTGPLLVTSSRTSTATAPIDCISDVRVRKFGKPDEQVRAGDFLTYTVVVDNLGPSFATTVTLKDVLQSSGIFDLVSVSSDRGMTCSYSPGVAPPILGIDQKLLADCSLNAPLETLGASAFPINPGRWLITMTVTAAQLQDLNNLATVFSSSDDPDQTNNQALVEHEITDLADLAVTKSDFPDPVVAGQNLTYTIRITNFGPSDSERVVLYDRLPSGIVVTAVSTSNGSTCSTGAPGNPVDRLTCGLGTIRSTGPVTTVVVTVNARVNTDVPSGTILENDVFVTAKTYDANSANDYAHQLTLVNTLADLAVQKFGNPNPLAAGTITSYDIVYTNNGPSVARDVILTDVLPPQLDFIRAFVVDGSPAADSATCFSRTEDPSLVDSVTCELGDLAAGETGRIVVIAQIRASAAAGPAVDTVTIFSLTTDPILANNTATFTTTIVTSADMLIEKTSDPVTVYAGEQKRYTIKITNLGPSDALNVVVTDTLPVQARYAVDTGLCTNNAGIVVCNFGTVPVSGTRSFDIYTVIDPATLQDLTIRPFGLTITNTAVVASTTPDPFLANNTAFRRNFVQEKSDLKVVKFGKRDGKVRAGDILTYTVIVDNLGPSFAYSVTLKDLLQSSGLFDVIDVVSDRAATCRSLPPGGPVLALPATPWPPVLAPPAFGVLPPTGVANVNQRYELDCTLASPANNPFPVISPQGGPQNPGRWIITMRVRARQEQDINNAAFVQSDVAIDPDFDNNNAFVVHEITAVADLQITKTDFPDPVIAGTGLTYTIRITNLGPSDAENTVFYDRLPPGIVVTGVSTSNGATCETGTAGSPIDRLTCGLGNIRATGPVTTVVITVTASVNSFLPQGTILENDVFVTSDVFDDQNGNNFANSLTTVGALSNLFVTKTDFPDPVVAGTFLEYKIHIENRGPSNAVNVRIQDALPPAAFVTFVGFSIANGTGTCFYQAATNEVFCNLGDIPAGSFRDVFIRLFVNPATPDGTILVNNVTITADSPIAFVPGSDFTEPTTVNARADLLIEKTSDPVMVYAGETKKYTIKITNNGPSDALNVVVTDTLPVQARYAVDTGLCNHNAGIVVCNFGTLVTGGMRTFDIYTVIDPATLQDLTIRPFGLTITNTAVVSSTTVDPNPANNIAFRRNFVQEKSDLKVVKFGKRDGQVRAGDILTYTVIVDNLGPSFAYSVTLKDVLQSSGIFDVIDVTSDRAATCRSLPPGGPVLNLPATPWPPALAPVAFGVLPPTGVANVNQRYELDCSLASPANNPFPVVSPQGGPQNPGRWIITMRVRSRQEQDINNSAYVQSDVAIDPDFDNNSAFVVHEITAVADLQVTKTDFPDPVIAGTPLTYTIRITNLGPSDAENTVLYDRLPPGIVLTSVTVSNGATCETGTPGNPLDRLVCGIGNLRSTGPVTTAVITVTTFVNSLLPQGTILENDVFVTSDVFDDQNGNNFANSLTLVGALSNLLVSKTDFPDPVIAGTFLEYRIRIANQGPSNAVNVRISDTLPSAAFVTFVSYNIGNGTGFCFYQNNTNEIDCNLGDIAVGSYREVFVRLFVDPATPDGTILTDTLNVLADSPIVFVPGSDFTENTTVIARADMVIEKTSDPVMVYAGETKKYTIKITNNGPSVALNVRVTDTLPVQAQYAVDTGLCTNAGQTVGCFFGTLPVGGMRTFDIYTVIDPATLQDLTIRPFGLTITNTAVVTSTTVDPITANNTAFRRNFVQEKSDLKVTKFGKKDGAVRAEEILTYTVIVDNLGPSFAYSVTLKDVLQSSGTYDVIDVSSDRPAVCRSLPAPPGGNPTAVPATPWPVTAAPPPFGVLLPTGVASVVQRYELDCVLNSPLGVLSPVGGPQNPGRWIITVRVRASQPQSVNNIAYVQSDVAIDPDFNNNSAKVEHEITAVADLAVTKTAQGESTTAGCAPGTVLLPNQVTAGRFLTYTITVTNLGASDAENVVLMDRLPPGVTLVVRPTVVSPANALLDCATGTPGNPLDKLTCGISIASAAGDTNLQPRLRTNQVVTFRYVVFVSPSLANQSVLENDVSVTSRTFDDDLSNNFTSNLTLVNTAADLTITKTDTPDPVVAGQQLNYTILVVNNGQSDAQNVIVTDTLPTQVNYISATGASCVQDPILTRQIVCTLGTIPAGGRRQFSILVQVKPDAVPPLLSSTTITNVATVGADTFDPCTTNNTTTVITTVNRVDDVFITKSDDPDPVLAGNQVTYTINFGNRGPSTATLISVNDTLPLGMRFNRCEPLDPNDDVTCIVTSGDGNLTPQNVQLVQIRRSNVVVWTNVIGGPLNDLDPNESYGFKLIADVQSGYVLDGRGDTGVGQVCRAFLLSTGYPHFAADRARISSLNDGGLAGNNFDDECTRVNSLADLSITDPNVGTANFFAQQALEVNGAARTDDLAADNGTAGTPDLAIDETSVQADGVVVDKPNQVAPPVLICDTVAPGGMLTYELVVRNLGPSDAAQVFVVDQLPLDGIVLDPALVTVSVSRGQVVEKRDDGRLTIIVGNDPNNLGVNQLGRLNANSVPVTITIGVMVQLGARCGSRPLNSAFVETRRNDVIWPLGANVTIARTPTLDPNLANNFVSRSTLIACPSLRVRKTVSFDGNCPGLSARAVSNQPGVPITFCFEITNNGDTFLDNIRITDTLRTRTGNSVAFTDVIRFGIDPKVPVAPGETVVRKFNVPAFGCCECGTSEDQLTASAVPVNSGRTVYPCLPLVTAVDNVQINIGCAGLDVRLALPVLNTGKCESWIQVQNAGSQYTYAMLVVWGDYGACPPQAAGPLKIECSGLIKPGSAWSFASAQLPAGSRSAMVYSLNATDEITNAQGNLELFGDSACQSLFNFVVGNHNQWSQFDTAYRLGRVYKSPFGLNGEQLVLDFGLHQGQPLAVQVNRKCPDVVDPNLNDYAAYVGISSDGQGAFDAIDGGFTFYAPLVFANKGGLNSWIYIQNTGTKCSSLELWFKAQDNCLRPILGDVLTLAPGETVHFDPNTVVGPDWIGSVWVRASQPMAMVIDTMGPNHFTSYNGIPGDVANDPARVFSLGSQVNYAPLIYSEFQGWDTAIQVQNLSAIVPAKVKVYFLDRSGDIITTLVDWICPRGSQTFFLPQIASLPGNWAGSARVESQEWWSPGSPVVDPPRIQSVVLLERWSDAQRTVRRQAAAYNAPTECTVYKWQIGKGLGGTQSGSAVIGLPLIAKGNRGVTSEIAITNVVPKPGFTDFVVFLFDQNGMIDGICQKVSEKEVDYIDLNTYGWVPPNFLGSAVISAVFWEHDVFDSRGVFLRNVVGLAAVNVERIGGVLSGPDVPGDESKAAEGIPLFDFFVSKRQVNCPGIGGVHP